MKKYLSELVENVKNGNAKKFIVVVLGVLGQVVALGLLPEPWQSRAVWLLAAAMALGVYHAKNAD